MTPRKANPRRMAQARTLRRTASATEKRLWQMLRGRQVFGFKFRRRSLVYGYIPDFWCPEAKVAIEIDGREYPAKRERDAVRDRRLISCGIRTVHVAADLVWRDSASALGLIQAALERQVGRADA